MAVKNDSFAVHPYVLIYRHGRNSAEPSEISEFFDSLSDLYKYLFRLLSFDPDMEYYHVCKLIDSSYGSQSV